MARASSEGGGRGRAWTGDVRCRLRTEEEGSTFCSFCAGPAPAGYRLKLVAATGHAITSLNVCQSCGAGRIGRQLREAANLMEAPDAEEDA